MSSLFVPQWLVLLVLLAQSTSGANTTTAPHEPQTLLELISNHSVILWAIAKWTGNLGKIIDFCRQYLTPKKPEITYEIRQRLRKQLIGILQTTVSKRLNDSLHNLVRIDLEHEEQRQRVGRSRLELIEPIWYLDNKCN